MDLLRGVVFCSAEFHHVFQQHGLELVRECFVSVSRLKILNILDSFELIEAIVLKLDKSILISEQKLGRDVQFSGIDEKLLDLIDNHL
ncbi:hypothetical protein PMAYCL1PPCAC_24954, partial [Pristionchus mayeri]